MSNEQKDSSECNCGSTRHMREAGTHDMRCPLYEPELDSSETVVEINSHKFVGTGAGELGMTPCERCGALERDLIHVDKFRETAVAGVPERIWINRRLEMWTIQPYNDDDIEYVRARAYSSSAVEAFDAEIARQAEFGMYPSVDDFRIALRQADSPSVAGPCSPCGDGDTAMKYHGHDDASPSVDEADKVLFGELWLDAQGEAHFICHTKDDDFAKTKDAFQKFIALLEGQLRNEKECPFYSADSVDEAARRIINQARVEELEALDICEFCQVPISAERHNEPTFNVCGTCYNQTVNSLNAKVSQLEQALKESQKECTGDLLAADPAKGGHVFLIGHLRRRNTQVATETASRTKAALIERVREKAKRERNMIRAETLAVMAAELEKVDPELQGELDRKND